MLRSLLLFLYCFIFFCGAMEAQLMISELCDPQNSYQQNRYIEIYNPTSCPVDLTGWRVQAISNNSVCHTWNLSGTINAGEAMVCGSTAATGAVAANMDFASAGQWSYSTGSCIYNWNGQARDGAQLLNPGGAIVDFVKAGTGTSPKYFENDVLVRRSTVCEPRTTYSSTEWNQTAVANAGTGNSTPGFHTGSPYCGPDDPCVILAVDLIHFDVEKQEDGSHQLRWQTANEVNMDLFVVEISNDGIDYQVLSEVKAQGDGANVFEYSYNHPSPFNSYNYYRLRLVENDGYYTYSSVRTLFVEPITRQINIFPNPIGQQATIQLSTALTTHADLQVVDMLGRVVYRQQLQADTQQWTLNGSLLEAGAYVLQIQTAKGEYYQRQFIK